MPLPTNRATFAALRSRADTPSVIAILVLLAVLTLVLATAIGSPQKDDVAWLLYVARKWLGGQRLYEDLVEVNPPLIVWIYAVPAALASWLDVAPKTVSAPFFAAILLACAWCTASLLHGRAPIFARRLPAFGAIGTVLLLLPGVEFGQREHLLVAAMLPYLALFARDMGGDPARPATSILVGVLAGLGCALKPSYAITFVALELLGRFRGGRMFRLPAVAAAAALGLYGVGVLVFCPAFLEDAVPLALALYGGTDSSGWRLLTESRAMWGGVAVALLLCAVARRTLPNENLLRHLLLSLTAFALAAAISYMLQGKDWFYHSLPATAATVLALLLWAVAVLPRLPRPTLSVGWVRRAVPTALALLALAEFGTSSAGRLQTWIEAAVEPELSTAVRLERLVRHEKAKTYIAFSEWIALGFPVVNETGVTWASRFDSMWALKGELWRARRDGGAPAEWPIRRWVARDFVANCPDLAVVDTREGINYVAVLSASDPAFAEAWSRYRQIASFDGLRVLKRDEAGCVPPGKRRSQPRMTATAMEPP
jgi:hypothetical protein